MEATPAQPTDPPSAPSALKMIKESIFCDVILSYLPPQCTLELMQDIPEVSNLFNLPTQFCHVHGNRLKEEKYLDYEKERSNTKRKYRHGCYSRGRWTPGWSYQEWRKNNPAPHPDTCHECHMIQQGYERCSDCHETKEWCAILVCEHSTCENKLCHDCQIACPSCGDALCKSCSHQLKPCPRCNRGECCSRHGSCHACAPKLMRELAGHLSGSGRKKRRITPKKQPHDPDRSGLDCLLNCADCESCQDPDNMWHCLSCNGYICTECPMEECATCNEIVSDSCCNNGDRCSSCEVYQCGACRDSNEKQLYTCRGCDSLCCVECDGEPHQCFECGDTFCPDCPSCCGDEASRDIGYMCQKYESRWHQRCLPSHLRRGSRYRPPPFSL